MEIVRTKDTGPLHYPRDAIASQLLRYGDGHGDNWADIIDFLTMHPEERRRVVRLLGEIQAARLSKDPPCDYL
jgi:hypothetical protein